MIPSSMPGWIGADKEASQAARYFWLVILIIAVVIVVAYLAGFRP